MTLTSRQFFAERKLIVDLADKYRLPAIYFQKEFVDEGGLMSYGADYDDTSIGVRLFTWTRS
jgi:putative tryptophan/tyrosine transport system substrate-binding protein